MILNVNLFISKFCQTQYIPELCTLRRKSFSNFTLRKIFVSKSLSNTLSMILTCKKSLSKSLSKSNKISLKQCINVPIKISLKANKIPLKICLKHTNWCCLREIFVSK